MSGRYILNGNGAPERCDDLKTWAKWFEDYSNHRVALSANDAVQVSTVFLGLDHSFGGSKPVLWETMIFGGEYDQHQYRYTSSEDAIAGHRRACELAGVVL